MTDKIALFTSLGAEFLCGVAWPLAMAVYGETNSFFIALLAWTAMSTMLVAMTPRSRPPVVFAGVALFDAVYDGARRTPKTESGAMLAVRLAMQWMGGFVGIGLAKQYSIGVGMLGESRLIHVWVKVLARYDFTWVLAAHTLVNALGGAAWMRNAETPGTQFGAAWNAIRSGVWMGGLTLPWGGPGFMLVSYMWVQYSFPYASVVVVGTMLVSTVLSGALANVLCEMSYAKSATIPLTPVTTAKIRQKKRGLEMSAEVE